MSLHVVEKSCVGKRGPSGPCEDVIVRTATHAAAIDGATPRAPFRLPHATAEELAARAIGRAVTGLDPMADIDRFHHAIMEAFSTCPDLAAYRQLSQERDENADRPAASLAVWSAPRRELWQLGDVQALVDGVLMRRETAIDHIKGQIRACHLEAALAQGVSLDDVRGPDTDPGWNAIRRELALQDALFLNGPLDCPLAFGAADGRAGSRAWLTATSHPGAHEIVLASDGYPTLYGTLQESEAHLAALPERDLLLFREVQDCKECYPGQTSFDDRAYLWVIMT